MSEAVLDTRKVRPWGKYSSYQTIGLDWVDRVPDHWIVKRLKWSITACQNGIWGDEPTGDEDEVGCVRVADFDRLRFVLDESVELTKRSVPKDKQVGRLLNRGDLLLEKSGGGDNQPVGALVLFDSDAVAVCSNFVAKVAVADGYCGSYLRYLHACLYVNRVNTRSMKQATGIQNLDSGQYFDEKVAFPSLDEQRAIAAFLDRETARIDAIVVKKQRLIDLLEEKRQAVVSRAVTSGLEQSVEKKESGLEWIDKIPADWNICALKYTWRQCDYGLSDSVSELGEVKVLTMGNVRDGEVSLPEIGAWNDVPEEMLLRDKDLLFNRTNSQVHVGKVGIFREVPGEKVSFASYLVRLRFTESADPEFMNYFLNNTAFLKSAQSNAYPSINQSNLNPTRYGALKVCLPSIETQRRIVTFLHAEKKRVGELVSRIKSGVQLLLEHRVALISAAVTGQIDVREEVQLDE